MIAAAYIITSILAVIGGEVTGLDRGTAFLGGILAAAVPVAVAAFINRKKTAADIAVSVAQELRQDNEDLRSRVADAESKARLAEGSEHECLRRVAQLEARLNAITAVATKDTPTGGD